MARKLFLRLDQSSLQPSDVTAIVGSSAVSAVDSAENCFQFTFAPVVLDHAMLLMGENKSRFGFDLWHYLYSARGFFAQTVEGLLLMPDGSSDFKRRYSEDLGVAVGSLFMVGTLQMKWETIAQIPINKTLSKHAKTPDFVGFDLGGQKRVYECKGTTQPQEVDKYRQKAKQQLGQHHEAKVTKFAIVTYVPNAPKLLPPFLFVSDPPIELPLMTESMAFGIHYLQVCQFAGLDELLEPLRAALATRLVVEEMLATEEVTWQAQNNFRAQMQQLVRQVEQIEANHTIVEFQSGRYVGVWREVEEQKTKVKAFTGVSVSQMKEMAAALAETPESSRPFRTPRHQEASTVHSADQPLYSLLSDGTLLLYG